MKSIIQFAAWMLFSILFVYCNPLFAHGEEKPGPHGGWIRMPGAFHTEVVPKQTGFEVYLLDINFTHPIVTDSSVNAIIKYDSKSVKLTCKKLRHSFLCTADKSLLKKASSLEIFAIRQHAKGNIAVYPLSKAQ